MAQTRAGSSVKVVAISLAKSWRVGIDKGTTALVANLPDLPQRLTVLGVTIQLNLRLGKALYTGQNPFRCFRSDLIGLTWKILFTGDNHFGVGHSDEIFRRNGYVNKLGLRGLNLGKVNLRHIVVLRNSGIGWARTGSELRPETQTHRCRLLLECWPREETGCVSPCGSRANHGPEAYGSRVLDLLRAGLGAS